MRCRCVRRPSTSGAERCRRPCARVYVCRPNSAGQWTRKQLDSSALGIATRVYAFQTHQALVDDLPVSRDHHSITTTPDLRPSTIPHGPRPRPRPRPSTATSYRTPPARVQGQSFASRRGVRRLRLRLRPRRSRQQRKHSPLSRSAEAKHCDCDAKHHTLSLCFSTTTTARA